MTDPFNIVRDFEAALCDYTGASYCVTTTSCTMALLLACAYHKQRLGDLYPIPEHGIGIVSIPKRTYVGVPMSIKHAGWEVSFRDENWAGFYHLKPLGVFDSARWLTENMYIDHAMICVSFHPTKTLGISTHGGAILHDDSDAHLWLRRARFDGRSEGVPAHQDWPVQLGWHCYMNPVTAAEGLMRLRTLPKRNDPLPNDDYPDLSTMELFK